jgi:hypothetical protein
MKIIGKIFNTAAFLVLTSGSSYALTAPRPMPVPAAAPVGPKVSPEAAHLRANLDRVIAENNTVKLAEIKAILERK